MKLCRSMLYLFLVSFLSLTLLVGCESSSKPEDTQEKTNDNTIETEDNNNNDSSNSAFEEYNILSFSNLELNKEPKYEGDDYYHLKTKVTNNSNKTVRTITVSFFVYDKNGDMIVSQQGQEMGSLEDKKSLNIEEMVNKDKDMDNIKINHYSYYIGSKYYSVDLISKYAEVYSD